MNLAQHKVKILVILPLVSSIVLGFGIYQFFYASSQNLSGSIALAWSPLQQKIVNGTLWINVTWTWQTENLSMTVKVNDDDFYYLDYVGYAFDKNRNGIIEKEVTKDNGATGIFPYNQYWVGALNSLGGISFFSMGLQPSKYYTCTFSNETGYEFKMSFPKTLCGIDHPILLHLIFSDVISDISGDGVIIEFEV